jgi:hypothetical protein
MACTPAAGIVAGSAPPKAFGCAKVRQKKQSDAKVVHFRARFEIVFGVPVPDGSDTPLAKGRTPTPEAIEWQFSFLMTIVLARSESGGGKFEISNIILLLPNRLNFTGQTNGQFGNVMHQSVFFRHIELGAIIKPPPSRFGVQVECEVARLPINKTDNCRFRPIFNCRPSRGLKCRFNKTNWPAYFWLSIARSQSKFNCVI